MVPFSEKAEKIVNLISIIYDASVDVLENTSYELGGHYEHYRVSISWNSENCWDGGTTYTHYSYNFVYVWDTHTQRVDFWHLVDSENNTTSSVVLN